MPWIRACRCRTYVPSSLAGRCSSSGSPAPRRSAARSVTACEYVRTSVEHRRQRRVVAVVVGCAAEEAEAAEVVWDGDAPSLRRTALGESDPCRRPLAPSLEPFSLLRLPLRLPLLLRTGDSRRCDGCGCCCGSRATSSGKDWPDAPRCDSTRASSASERHALCRQGSHGQCLACCTHHPVAVLRHLNPDAVCVLR